MQLFEDQRTDLKQQGLVNNQTQIFDRGSKDMEFYTTDKQNGRKM